MDLDVKTQIKLVGPGTKARLWTESEAACEARRRENLGDVTNVCQIPPQLPIVLAGPVVRRVDANQATFWLATSVDLLLKCVVININDPAHRNDTVESPANLVGQVDSTTITKSKLGEQLFVYVATVRAAIPAGQLLAYNFDLVSNDPKVLGFMGDVVLNPGEVTVGGLALPTFFLSPPQSDGVRMAHASCRKFHAPNVDAMPLLQGELDRTAVLLAERPSALHLTGDQIYADDVDPDVIDGLTDLGRALLGWDEVFPDTASSVKKVHEFRGGSRSFINNFGLTVDANVAGNHLLGFGDYAAMYVLAWSPEIWTWNGQREPPSFGRKTVFSSPAMRRVLANAACYMICDDHEVTDDWNLNTKWKRDTERAGNPVARRLFANALAAYWAFQACGNDPGPRDGALRGAILAHLQGRGANPGAFETALLGFHDWHFTAPTSRPTIFLDTRTRREFMPIPAQPDPPGMLNPPPGLLNDAGFALFEQALHDAGGTADDPLVIVSPAPFLGYVQAEDGVALMSNLYSPTKPIDPMGDPEAWVFNTAAFAKFLKTLAKSGRKHFVILSGDVHYAYTAFASCTVRSGSEQRTFTFVQATSSAIHNEPDGLSATALWKVNNDDDTHMLFGEPGPNREYYLTSAEFRKNNHLGMPANWDLQLRWRYMKMGPNSVVATNNVAIVVANRADVTHKVFAVPAQNRQGTPAAQASIAWSAIAQQVPTPVTAL